MWRRTWKQPREGGRGVSEVDHDDVCRFGRDRNTQLCGYPVPVHGAKNAVQQECVQRQERERQAESTKCNMKRVLVGQETERDAKNHAVQAGGEVGRQAGDSADEIAKTASRNSAEMSTKGLARQRESSDAVQRMSSKCFSVTIEVEGVTRPR